MSASNNDPAISENSVASTLTPELESNMQSNEIAKPGEKEKSKTTLTTDDLADLYYLADMITITEDEDKVQLEYEIKHNTDHDTLSQNMNSLDANSHSYTHAHTQTSMQSPRQDTYISNSAQPSNQNQQSNNTPTTHIRHIATPRSRSQLPEAWWKAFSAS